MGIIRAGLGNWCGKFPGNGDSPAKRKKRKIKKQRPNGTEISTPDRGGNQGVYMEEGEGRQSAFM